MLGAEKRGAADLGECECTEGPAWDLVMNLNLFPFEKEQDCALSAHPA